MIEPIGWCPGAEAEVDINRVPLARSYPLPVHAQAEALLGVGSDYSLQVLARDPSPGRVRSLEQFVHRRPAAAVQPEANKARVVAQDPAEEPGKANVW